MKELISKIRQAKQKLDGIDSKIGKLDQRSKELKKERKAADKQYQDLLIQLVNMA